ncbi:MAG TPA: class II fumarate hydratase [Clostridia bacterium]|nr:class II fumarate hydratase [Clostridia bacterium]
MEVRTERDSMGEVKVEAHRLWGAQTQRSLAHFKIGGLMPLELIHAIARIKGAAAQANAALGCLEQQKAEAIAAAAEEILRGTYDDAFPLCIYQTGSGTQTNMNVNEVIVHLCALRGVTVHPNDHVNLGQSTNDVFPSAMHVSAVLGIRQSLLPALRKMLDVMNEHSVNYKCLIKLGRTHLQDAVPVTLGQEFSGYAAMLHSGIQMLEAALPLLYELPLGGTAVGTGLNAHKALGEKGCARLAESCGMPFVAAPNKFQGLTSKNALVFAHGALSALAADLFKVADDIRLLASGPRGGFGELILPENEPGSSIMPGKVNPTQCEALQMVCARVHGNHASVSFAASQGHLELNAMMPGIAADFLESVRLLSEAIKSFTEHCLIGLEPNLKAIKLHLGASLMLVTALSPRIGYENAAHIAQRAHKEGLTLREAALESGLVSPEEFDTLVRPETMI